LLIGHRKLRVANETVTRDFEALARRNAELKQRLTAVIERIRALEEAQNA
jgi:FtsZ-binding cell division protein ZapB